MKQIWKPSALGKLVTNASDWSLTLEDESVHVTVRGRTLSGGVGQFQGLTVKSGVLWAAVRIPFQDGKALELDGIPNAQAFKLRHAVKSAIEEKRERARIAVLLRDFDQQAQPILGWVREASEACERQIARRGWLSRDFIARIEAGKPALDRAWTEHPEVQAHLQRQPDTVQQAFRMWQRPFSDFARAGNQAQTAKALEEHKSFFDRVEKSPLTPEQRQAVLCFDSRVLLVAAAGSGKTSVMVAKAGYALQRGYFEPERMLLLAFNTDAAAELRERIQARLTPLGLRADRITAKTFHAFGLEIIGAATGKKPSLAPWLEGGKDLETLVQLVYELKDSDPTFRTQWDLFRVVLGQDLPKFGREQDNPTSWDYQKKRGGFWTLQGETVKSQGEVVLANWLFYNGVRYVYEGAYEHDTADATHRQYLPDFYLPDANAYLEHWALDARGEPPEQFVGYKADMAWKRKLHRDKGTRLLETTMAELWSGKAFEYLSSELPKLGITPDPNPSRPVPGRQPIENPRLAGTFRSFLTHVKSNRLSMQDLRVRLSQETAGSFRFRHEMFIRLFEKLWHAWEEKLRASKCIDFEDMLNLATDHVEAGRWSSPYELVMVDEFQDASQARARMARALLRGEDRHLFAVGDDWQSINRFAGADISVMTGFEKLFGAATTLKLETTFRCPPSLCDISSRFVQRNPNQIAKKVRSPKADVVDPVRIVQVDTERHIQAAVESRVREIAAEAAAAGKKATVYLLTRYRKESIYMPVMYDRQWVEIACLTVHRSKGLEADHVIVPRLTSEGMGFPSKILDDPVLQLAMPGQEAFEFAEERRLFYVAVTRAKSTATLVTVKHAESSFVTELVREEGLRIVEVDGATAERELCPKCGKGFLQQKISRFGPFHVCDASPPCGFKRDDKRRRSR